MATRLLGTKLYIPPLQPGLVHRPRLTRLINEGLARRLMLVSAPAGFGKTTLLCEWISGSRHLASWLSLEEADNDPIRFWAYFLAALQVLQEDLVKNAQDFLYAEGQQTSLAQLEPFLTTLINDISAYPEDFALVLDDYHQITNQAIHAGIVFLIDHSPPRMHVILTCRSDPPMPLPRLRARGHLVELRAEDLRFTNEEAIVFLNQVMNLDLSIDQIAALETRTEGWIAGLQLAAISMQRSEDTTGFIESFTGSHRFILEYLVDEVLNCQPEDVQSFLLDTSILERFTASLCDAVTGKDDGQEILRQLERSNLFIIPLDNERRWHRYHNLFADLLRSRLQELKPDRVPVLHRRACEWFEREGSFPEAIHHAIAVRDFERTAHLIEMAAEVQRQQGEIATLTAWMNTLPGNVRRSHPALCLAYARALVDTAQNETIEVLVEEAVAALELDRSSDDLEAPAVIRGQIAALRAYLAMIHHQFRATIEFACHARELLGGSESRWRGFVALIQAGAYRFTNEWAAAEKTYLEASELSQAAGDRVNALLALSLRGEVLQAEGHLHQAAQQYERVLQLAREWAIPNAPVTGYALLGLARVWCEWNGLEAADRFAGDGIAFGQRANIQDMLLRGYIALARVRQARGDFAGALDALDNADAPARQIGIPEVKDWIQAIRVQLWLDRGETQAVTGWAASYTSDVRDSIYPSIAIALAKASLVEGQPEAALRLLEHALQSAQEVGRLGNALQILVVKALVQRLQGDTEDALATLSRALAVAEPEGYMRAFLDEGEPMRRLLADFGSSMLDRERDTLPSNRQALLDYANRLSAAFTVADLSHSRKSTGHPVPLPGPEPLSERELEVLRLMAAGLSSRDIASRDVVSINTVKTQLKSIYGKLGAHNRNDAITAAHDLGLL